MKIDRKMMDNHLRARAIGAAAIYLAREIRDGTIDEQTGLQLINDIAFDLIIGGNCDCSSRGAA